MGNNMESEIIFQVEEDPAGGFCATSEDFSICPEAASMDELKAMVRDAVCCHYEGNTCPVVILLRTSKGEVIRA